ncbi:F0F1 ATP synthase subunit gamma [Thalassospira xiamenensis]|uniref:F0F1 ATP synthase subunit gamma n=1 Tax=Thalassospira xiamenensis TaxID=220697 RepID=UPI001E366B68|nr:FoF1 ATP synthase subunit gamma [Thalassospira xiamenensis]MCD1595128.1 F0F1 ATP synthase subunit gamma [Thalassospira xiamenensis]
MTERLADVSERIEGIRQLGAVVNAMKGIAAARSRDARKHIKAVDGYASTIANAMRSTLSPEEHRPTTKIPANTGKGLLVFCAEQGFAGAFSEHVLEKIAEDLKKATMFLIGTRGLSIARTRGIYPFWSTAMPSHTPGIPKMADNITKAIYGSVEVGKIDSLDVIYSTWHSGRPEIVRHSLFPIDLTEFASHASQPPMMQLPKAALLDSLSADYFHALVCKSCLHAFAAENEARLEAMSAAASQIERELDLFQAKLRQVRQEEITAEIIELGTGTASAHHKK